MMKTKTTSKTISHAHGVVAGINQLIDMKAVKVMGSTIHLYPELWGEDPKKQIAWMNNAYLYLRLTNQIKENSLILFKDLETHQLIGKHEHGHAITIK